MGQARPRECSLVESALPIGLAHNVPLKPSIAAGDIVRWTDVALLESDAGAARDVVLSSLADRCGHAIEGAGGVEFVPFDKAACGATRFGPNGR